MFTWKERWILVLVRLRARESVSLGYAGPVQVNVCRQTRVEQVDQRSSGPARTDTRLTSDIGAAIGEIQTRLLAAALYSPACARGSIQRPIGHSVDTGWLTVESCKKINYSSSIFSVEYFEKISISRTWRFQVFFILKWFLYNLTFWIS